MEEGIERQTRSTIFDRCQLIRSNASVGESLVSGDRDLLVPEGVRKLSPREFVDALSRVKRDA